MLGCSLCAWCSEQEASTMLRLAWADYSSCSLRSGGGAAVELTVENGVVYQGRSHQLCSRMDPVCSGAEQGHIGCTVTQSAAACALQMLIEGEPEPQAGTGP